MKILCLGNTDNLGIKIYSWLKKSGIDVHLCKVVADEDFNRGNSFLYSPTNEEHTIFSYTKDLLQLRYEALFGSTFTRKLENNYDCIIITGGFHALLLSTKINAPKIFMPVGYEIHYHANKFRTFPGLKQLGKGPRSALRNYFYSTLVRKSLYNCSVITDSFPTNIEICESLGLGNKIKFLGFAEDVEHNRSIINFALLEKLNKETSRSKRIFLWLSRLNFLEPSQAAYKGAEIFLKALRKMKNQITTKEITVYVGKHGVDKDSFIKLAMKYNIYKDINWVEHLDYGDLLAYLSIKNAVLFSEFGNNNTCISGIGRDAYTIGTPLINQTTDEIMIKQYTKPGNRYYASNETEVLASMRYFLSLTNDEYANLQNQTKKYGENYIDIHFYISRLEKIIKETILDYAKKKLN